MPRTFPNQPFPAIVSLRKMQNCDAERRCESRPTAHKLQVIFDVLFPEERRDVYPLIVHTTIEALVGGGLFESAFFFDVGT